MTLLAYVPSSGLTLGALAEGVLSALYGQTSQTDSVAALVGDLDATATTFTVDDASDLSAGWLEVDTELMRVVSVDTSNNTVRLAPTGRGRRGTEATPHLSGAEVRIQPIVPYSSVVREINAELATIFPRVCAAAYVEMDANPSTSTYELPFGCSNVLDVRYRDTLGEWQRVRSWEVEQGGNLDDITTGVSLRMDAPLSTRIRVIYGTAFGRLSSLDDSLADAGVPESLEDVIRYGAVCRLLPTLDIARLSVTSTASSEANGRPPTPGTGVMVARELRAAYRDRLEQEIRTFRQYFPPRTHRTR